MLIFNHIFAKKLLVQSENSDRIVYFQHKINELRIFLLPLKGPSVTNHLTKYRLGFIEFIDPLQTLLLYYTMFLFFSNVLPIEVHHLSLFEVKAKSYEL